MTMQGKQWPVFLLSFLLAFCLCACNAAKESAAVSDGGTTTGKSEDSSTKIDVQVGSTVLTATLAGNSSAAAFADLLRQGDVTVAMHDYNHFEKVGDLPQSIVTNDKKITTAPGDIILYQGNQITIYYDTNTWNFTKLGKIDGVTQRELTALLGEGNVRVTFRIHKQQAEQAKAAAFQLNPKPLH